MKEIKFRVWLVEEKLMVYFGLFDTDMDYLYFAKDKDGNFDLFVDEENDIIMQYIGLKDKNGSGKKAYHKDIISAYGYSNWIIEWYKNGWYLKQFDCENYKEIPEDFIIIGNIYENPELLEDK